MRNLSLAFILFSVSLVQAQLPTHYSARIFKGKAVSGIDATHSGQIRIPDGGGVVLFFTGTRCPYDDLYRKRLTQLQERYEGKVQFFFVNAMPDESEVEMRKQVNEWDSVIPYVIDSAQWMARTLGVKKTTETFLLRHRGPDFELYFRGPVDDNPQVETDTEHEYLDHAIAAMLAGKTSPGHFDRLPGCLVRMKN